MVDGLACLDWVSDPLHCSVSGRCNRRLCYKNVLRSLQVVSRRAHGVSYRDFKTWIQNPQAMSRKDSTVMLKALQKAFGPPES